MESKKINNVYAVVIWFHPTEREVGNILLYQNDVDGIIVVDNSENDNRRLLLDIPELIYLPQIQNLGVAAALNIGCRQALKQGAQWVLTMDQDSKWNQQSVKQYIAEADQYKNLDKVAIFSPYHDCDGYPEKHHKDGRFELRNVVMCSGNLLRLKAWQDAGGFREDFFIDSVDDEVCCHVRQIGWQVIRLNHILLTHHLGNGIRYLGLTKHPYTPHPVWRYYYIARNIRRMQRLYPDMKKYYSREIRKYLKRLLLYDWNRKRDKLYEFFRGMRDA